MKIIYSEQALDVEVYYVELEPVFSPDRLANPGQYDHLAGMIYGTLEAAKSGLAQQRENLRSRNINHAAHNGFEYHEKEADFPVSEREIDYDLPADLAIWGGWVDRSSSNDD